MKCPGKYCGIRTEAIGNASFCGPCPWGFRVNPSTFNCEPCRHTLIWHDYMYLAFITILPAMVHSFYHEITSGRTSTSKLWPIYYIYLILETAISIVLTMILLPPIGTFELHTCGVQEFSDWYPMFSNPTLQNQQTLHCSQEVVYPLYSMPFVFYGIWFIFSVCVRPLVGMKLSQETIGAVGPSLYFCPLIVLVHALSAGLIYYSFPYLVVIVSLTVNALLLATVPIQTVRGLLAATIEQPRQVFLLLSLVLVNALGVLSLFPAAPDVRQLWIFLVIPGPVIFYVITVPFTDPAKIALSSH